MIEPFNRSERANRMAKEKRKAQVKEWERRTERILSKVSIEDYTWMDSNRFWFKYLYDLDTYHDAFARLTLQLDDIGKDNVRSYVSGAYFNIAEDYINYILRSFYINPTIPSFMIESEESKLVEIICKHLYNTDFDKLTKHHKLNLNISTVHELTNILESNKNCSVELYLMEELFCQIADDIDHCPNIDEICDMDIEKFDAKIFRIVAIVRLLNLMFRILKDYVSFTGFSGYYYETDDCMCKLLIAYMKK